MKVTGGTVQDVSLQQGFEEALKVHKDRHESGKELFPKPGHKYIQQNQGTYIGGKGSVHQCGKCGELCPTRIVFRKHKRQCQKSIVVKQEKPVKKSKCLFLCPPLYLRSHLPPHSAPLIAAWSYSQDWVRMGSNNGVQ